MGPAKRHGLLGVVVVTSALWLSPACSSSSSSEGNAAGRGGTGAGGTGGSSGVSGNAGAHSGGGDSGADVAVLDGAAGSDAAVRDGGADASADSGDGSSPPSCSSGPGGIFCDDFEAVGLRKWSRYAQGSDGRTTRVASPVHRGVGAVRSVKFAPGSSDPLYADVLGARNSGRLYLRVYLYIPSGFSISTDSAASLLVLGESAGALGGLSLVLWQEALSLTVAGVTRGELKDTVAVARNRWHCMQIDFGIGQATSARLRMNGQVVAEGTLDTRMATGYTRLWLGVNWIHENQTQAVEALYDDLVVSTRDVPCD